MTPLHEQMVGVERVRIAFAFTILVASFPFALERVGRGCVPSRYVVAEEYGG